MKSLYLPFFCVLILWACTKPTSIPFPPEENVSSNTIKVSLGNYQVANSSLFFSPYYSRNHLVFKNGDGDVFPFSMAQPVYHPGMVFEHIFDHPTEPGKKIIYEFAGDQYEYEFLSMELGVKLEIIIQPDLCDDPELERHGQVQDHLMVNARGFLLNESKSPNPVLDISIPDANICERDKESAGFFPQLTLLDETFENVYYSRVSKDGFVMEIFYSEEDGVVSIRTSKNFYVLER